MPMPNYVAYAFLAAGLFAALFTCTHRDEDAFEVCQQSHAYATCYNALNH